MILFLVPMIESSRTPFYETTGTTWYHTSVVNINPALVLLYTCAGEKEKEVWKIWKRL